MPDGEEVEEVESRRSGDDDAKDASSRESRAYCCGGACRFPYCGGRDIVYSLNATYDARITGDIALIKESCRS
jgi:hypothetical protein